MVSLKSHLWCIFIAPMVHFHRTYGALAIAPMVQFNRTYGAFLLHLW